MGNGPRRIGKTGCGASRDVAVLALVVPALCLAAACFAAEDLLIADFEARDYGAWQVDGEAFGPGPARGTLPGQMRVSGFEGQGLVNTFYKGDGTTGTLTSPAFRIERKYINFLAGGGKYPGETCMNLLVDGEVVRTATGPNDRPGGSERLDWQQWDVAQFMGNEGVIRIVDARTGGWGHINVDHIVQSDERPIMDLEKSFVFDKRFLNFPVKNGAPMRRLTLSVDDEVRYFDVELAEAEPDFWAFIDVAAFAGKTGILRTEVSRTAPATLDAIVQADAIAGAEDLYREKHRPQFHFSSRRGWNNDPNGLVYYDGEYHLFYQHNPFGWRWGNMHWGHAVSLDLVHWTELPDALCPDALGTVYSGSAVVDERNTAGLQTGDERVLVCIYTSAGSHAPASVPFTQSIAYSNDRGRTWTKYDANPVLGHLRGANRDPKVLWHEPTSTWIMALYLDEDDYALFGSADLKSWAKVCDVLMPGTRECPDFFELPVDGDASNTRWVFWGANGNYVVGTFDGSDFVKEGEVHCLYAGGNAYAAQTFSDVPADDGRRIQIPWMRQEMPGMPFNQMMGFPVELTLRTTPDGIRMFAEPVKELEGLHAAKHAWVNQILRPGGNALAGLEGDLFDIRAEIELGDAQEFGFVIRGVPVAYNAAQGKLTCNGKTADLEPMDGTIRLRILVDRASIEIFANDGLVYLPVGIIFKDDQGPLVVFAKGGAVELADLSVFELRSAWE